MSKHLNQNNRKKQLKRQKGILSVLSLYPDFGMDSEGYPAAALRMVLCMGAGAILLIAALVLRKNTLFFPLLSLASIAASGVFCLINLFYNIRRGR